MEPVFSRMYSTATCENLITVSGTLAVEVVAAAAAVEVDALI